MVFRQRAARILAGPVRQLSRRGEARGWQPRGLALRCFEPVAGIRTQLGREQLRSEERSWTRYVAAVSKIMAAAKASA